MGSLDERKLSETGVATDFSKEDAILYVNGKRYVLPPDAAHRTLLEYLRGWFHSIHFASQFRNNLFSLFTTLCQCSRVKPFLLFPLGFIVLRCSCTTWVVGA